MWRAIPAGAAGRSNTVAGSQRRKSEMNFLRVIISL
jgi:hypothetical protein